MAQHQWGTLSTAPLARLSELLNIARNYFSASNTDLAHYPRQHSLEQSLTVVFGYFALFLLV
jgi:hypothetical protein